MDGTLLVTGIVCLIAGFAWWFWNRVMDAAKQLGHSIGHLSGTTKNLGKSIGFDLQDPQGLINFTNTYNELLRDSLIPASHEARRAVFDLKPGDTFYHSLTEAEQWRRTALMLWHILGQRGQKDSQDMLKARLYNLYETTKKPTDGLRAEIGPNTAAATQEPNVPPEPKE